jgi:hypothetical protein
MTAMVLPGRSISIILLFIVAIEFSDQNIKADYRTNYFIGGLSYHFN